MPPLRRLLGALLLLPLAGCSLLATRYHDENLNTELVRLVDLALASAQDEADIRALIRANLRGIGRERRLVFIGGHRFLVAPATVDRLPPVPGLLHPRYRSLTSQSLELAETGCFAFLPPPERLDIRPVRSGTGVVTLSAAAEGVQLINAGIELRDGCIAAIHFEQASAQRRD